jgi:hypothetical protein
VSGRTTTIILPAFSGRFATSIAAHKAAPQEIPTSMPSSGKPSCCLAGVCSYFKNFMIIWFKTCGIIPRNPRFLRAGFPPDNTGDASGSTAIALGWFRF